MFRLKMDNKIIPEIIEIPTNDWTIKQITEKCPPKSWESVFERSKNEINLISDRLQKDVKDFGMYYPSNAQLFNAFESVKLDDVRVVILGQDPYPSISNNGKCTAIGKSFSVRKGDEIPPTLKNIYKEIERTIPNFKIPSHGNLSKWEKQGVFLLNTCLTFSPGRKNSGNKNHCEYELWTPFIIKVISAINKVNPKCIYLLWGAKAQKFGNHLDNSNIILTSSHPSPLSVYRGFNSCNHFKLVNEYLAGTPKGEIDWNLD
jgi:uracil-DNA glycosylase